MYWKTTGLKDDKKYDERFLNFYLVIWQFRYDFLSQMKFPIVPINIQYTVWQETFTISNSEFFSLYYFAHWESFLIFLLTGNFLVSKLDGYVVVSGLCGKVLHSTGTVSVVLTVDGDLGGSVDGQPQAALPRPLDVDGEHLGLVGETSL